MVKISVIVPVYKTAQYIIKCLESISSQTFEDFEVLCVDDCSPDESAELIREYAKTDDRVKLISHKENLGLGGARNTALKIAQGAYIASVDSDDTVKPNMLEKLYAATDNETADIVVCAFNRVDEHGKVLSTQTPYAGTLYNYDNCLDIFKVTNPAFWNKLWRKSLYIDNDIFFPNYVFYQDSATTPRIITQAKKIVLIKDVLYDYLVRGDSATFTYSPKHILDYLTVFDVLKNFLIEKGLWERYQYQFETMITTSLRFHAQNVAETDLEEGRKQAYLKQLMLLKLSFLKEDDGLRAHTSEELTAHLAEMPDEERAPLSLEAAGFKNINEQMQDPKREAFIKEYRKEELGIVAENQKKFLHTPRKLEDITIAVKTFQRPKIIKRFLKYVAEYQIAHNVQFREIIVGDDSSPDILAEVSHAIKEVSVGYEGVNIRHDIYEFNIGLSDARNRMFETAKSDYVILCDDDFVFDDECDIVSAFELMQEKKVDILGGWLKNNYDFETGDYSYWGAAGKMLDHKEELILFLNETFVEDFMPTDFLLNFYLARRDAVLDIKWDPELKIEEHYEFFYRFFKSPYKAALTSRLFVRHTNEKPHNPPEYNQYRFEKKNWRNALFLSIQKLGKQRRTVNRWRHDHYVQWHSDHVKKVDVQKRISLKQSIVAQRVPVERITPAFQSSFFGYFDVQAVSNDGRYHLYQSAPVMDRLPTPDDIASISLLDMKTGKSRQIGETRTWCHQQGCQLQYRRSHQDEVMYNFFDEEAQAYKSKSYNLQTEEEKTFPLPIAAIAPDGKSAVSINFSRMFDYRPGYGYCNLPDPFSKQNAPENDGLFSMDLETGKNRLILSYKDLHEQFINNRFPLYQNEKVLINHVGFNTDGTKLVMLFRVFSKTAPFPTLTIVCDADGQNPTEAFSFISHYHWRDAQTLLFSGAPAFEKKRVKSIELYEKNLEDDERRIIDKDFFKGDGHCTYSPDRKLVLYDSYSSMQFPYRKLQVYDLENERGIDIGYFFSPPQLHGEQTDCRCDLHPRWSPDGKMITFDSIHEGYRGIYKVNVADVLVELEKNFIGLTETQIRKLYSTVKEAQKPLQQDPTLKGYVFRKIQKGTLKTKVFYNRNMNKPVIGFVLKKICRPLYYIAGTPIYRILNR